MMKSIWTQVVTHRNSFTEVTKLGVKGVHVFLRVRMECLSNTPTLCYYVYLANRTTDRISFVSHSVYDK